MSAGGRRRSGICGRTPNGPVRYFCTMTAASRSAAGCCPVSSAAPTPCCSRSTVSVTRRCRWSSGCVGRAANRSCRCAVPAWRRSAPASTACAKAYTALPRIDPMLFRLLLLAAICALSLMNPARAEELRVLAAGSLREAMTALGDRYREATGISVTTEFGPSGLMRERIEKGEHVDLFASADMGHPLKLLHDGRATRVAMFVRNTLCGVAVPRVGLTTANFIDRLLDPSVKLSTSTPNADPAGDYTWAMFHRIDAQRPGSFAILDKKAQQIVGGPANNAPAGGADPAVAALADGRGAGLGHSVYGRAREDARLDPGAERGGAGLPTQA